jgi:hypothetical protein
MRGGQKRAPEPNPETPPDSADPTGVCPRCGRNSNFKGIAPPIPLKTHPNLRGAQGEWFPVERVSGLLCMGCGNGVAVVEELYYDDGRHWTQGGGGTQRWHGVMWWPFPAASGLSEAIPESIRDCFGEGLVCLAARAPRGAAVMFRRTLEAIVRDKGSAAAVKAMEDKNLASGLRVMSNEHTLTPDLAEWAEKLKLEGNAGAHYDPMKNVSQDDADELGKLLGHLLNYLYEVPARIKRAKTTQP